MENQSIRSLRTTSTEVDITQLNLPFVVEKNISDERITWILKAITSRKISQVQKRLCGQLFNDDPEIFFDVLIINPVNEILKSYPTALVVDEKIKTIDCTTSYNIFGTKMYYSICHGKYYVLFKKEQILFSLNLNSMDEIHIIKTFNIKYVFTSDGHIYNALERYIYALIS